MNNDLLDGTAPVKVKENIDKSPYGEEDVEDDQE
jgi:hypothetical protein